MILEEGIRPYSRCPQCDMLMPYKALNGWHLTTELCRWVMERKWCGLAEEEAQEGTEREITAYRVPLFQVTSFKYPWRILTAEENDWPEVVHNLWCARHKWERMDRVLRREGAES